MGSKTGLVERGRATVDGGAERRRGRAIGIAVAGMAAILVVAAPRQLAVLLATAAVTFVLGRAGASAAVDRLAGELQSAEERVLTAREDERRRLRCDLHDGLGPFLTSNVLQLQTARRLLHCDSGAADAMLAGLVEATASATDELRRVLEGLRPESLDRLGLVGAVEEQASRLAGHAHARGTDHGLLVAVEASQDLGPLPAAVEVAAFRIISEAVHNASRHAQAQDCTVRLARSRLLEIEVVDDGVGLSEPGRSGGIGMKSIRERAAALGGTILVESAPGRGTRVLARLPLGVRAGVAA